MSYRMLFALSLSLSLYVGGISAAQNSNTSDNTFAKKLHESPYRNHPGGVREIPGIIYSAINGYRPLRLDLFLPSSGKAPFPAVVFLHGGAWMMDAGTDDPLTGSSVLAKLAARGYVVARATYRLSNEANFPAQVTDVKAAVRWLRSNAKTLKVDPDRVAVWGASSGGYLAAMVGTSCQVKSFEVALAPPLALNAKPVNIDPATNSCVQSVVDWFAPIDFASMGSQASENALVKHDDAQSPESRLLGCTVPQCSAELLKQANPLSYVDANTPPFLIMHGTEDRLVPFQQSQQLYDALRAKNVAAQLVLVQQAGHVFADIPPAQAQAQLDVVFKFLDQQLKK